MRDVVRRAEQRFGAIAGVIHAAGCTRPDSFVPMSEMESGTVLSHLMPKVAGLRVLDRVLEGKHVGFRHCTSSLASVLGGLGFGAYAAANRVMDAMAQSSCSSGGGAWLSANWDGWNLSEEESSSDVRAAVVSRGAGRYAMSRREGAEAFSRLLGVEGLGRAVVSTGDLSLRMGEWIKPAVLAPAGTEAPARSSRHARAGLGTPFVAPSDSLEQTVAEIWQEMLGIEEVGVNDNFFELGGHSLMATQLTARLRELFQVEISLRTLFEAPTVAGISSALARALFGDVDRETRARLLQELESGSGSGPSETP